MRTLRELHLDTPDQKPVSICQNLKMPMLKFIFRSSVIPTGAVVVHAFAPADVSDAQVTDDEKSRAARFHFEKDAVHWIACRGKLRGILGEALGIPPLEVPLVLSPFGKPLLAPPFDSLHFNLSHCPDLALVALSNEGPVGIDIEAAARATDLLECEATFCHPGEIHDLPADPAARAGRLLDIWTAKESVLKALGTGLSHPPEAVRIHANSATSDEPLPGLEAQRIHRLDHPVLKDYRAALSAPMSVNDLRFT